MDCPNHTGTACSTCEGDGAVPDWLADPNINGEQAARTWG